MSLDTHIQSACIVFRLPVAPLKFTQSVIFPSHDNVDFVMSKKGGNTLGYIFYLIQLFVFIFVELIYLFTFVLEI